MLKPIDASKVRLQDYGPRPARYFGQPLGSRPANFPPLAEAPGGAPQTAAGAAGCSSIYWM